MPDFFSINLNTSLTLSETIEKLSSNKLKSKSSDKRQISGK